MRRLSSRRKRGVTLLSFVWTLPSCGGIAESGPCLDCGDDAAEPSAPVEGAGGDAFPFPIEHPEVSGGTGGFVRPSFPSENTGGTAPIATGGTPSVASGGEAPTGGTGGRPPAGTGGASSGGSDSGGASSGGSRPVDPCAASLEICDGWDNDCNGDVDENPWCGTCSDAVLEEVPYVFCDVPLSHFDAGALCDSWGLSLATPTTSEENDWLSAVGGERFSSKFWIGYDDRETEGVWLSPDGYEPAYENWHPGEPNDIGNNEHCVQLNRFWPSDTWNDEPCEAPLPFACEPKAAPPPCDYREVSLDVAFDSDDSPGAASVPNVDGLVFDERPISSLYVGSGDWSVTYQEERRLDEGGLSLVLNPGATGTFQTFYNAGGGAFRGSVIFVRRSGNLATSQHLDFTISGLPRDAWIDLVLLGQAQGQQRNAVNPTDMVIEGFDAGNGAGAPITLDAEGDGNFIGIAPDGDGSIHGYITYQVEFGSLSGLQLRSRSRCD